MLVPLKQRTDNSSVIRAPSKFHSKNDSTKTSLEIIKAVNETAQQQKLGEVATGRARKWFTTRESSKIDNNDYEEIRKRNSANLAQRVLNTVLRNPSAADPVSIEVIAASFADTALKHIQRELDDFPDRGAFFAHVHSKLDWLLKELGDHSDRLSLLQYKYDKMSQDHSELLKEKDTLQIKLESMKDLIKERTSTYHEAKTLLEEKYEQLRRENKSLKLRVQQLTQVTKKNRALLSSKPLGQPVEPSKLQDDEEVHEFGSTETRSKMFRNAMERADLGVFSTEHDNVVHEVSNELNMANQVDIVREVETIEKEFIKEKHAYEDKIQGLKSEMKKLQQHVKEVEAKGKADKVGLLKELGNQAGLCDTQKKELETLRKDYQETSLEKQRLQVSCNRMKETLQNHEEIKQKEFFEVIQRLEAEHSKSTVAQHNKLLRDALAASLAETNALQAKCTQLELIVESYSERVRNLKKFALDGPSSVEVLDKFRQFQVENLNHPNLIAFLRSHAGLVSMPDSSDSNVVARTVLNGLLNVVNDPGTLLKKFADLVESGIGIQVVEGSGVATDLGFAHSVTNSINDIVSLKKNNALIPLLEPPQNDQLQARFAIEKLRKAKDREAREHKMFSSKTELNSLLKFTPDLSHCEVQTDLCLTKCSSNASLHDVFGQSFLRHYCHLLEENGKVFQYISTLLTHINLFPFIPIDLKPTDVLISLKEENTMLIKTMNELHLSFNQREVAEQQRRSDAAKSAELAEQKITFLKAKLFTKKNLLRRFAPYAELMKKKRQEWKEESDEELTLEKLKIDSLEEFIMGTTDSNVVLPAEHLASIFARGLSEGLARVPMPCPAEDKPGGEKEVHALPS